MDQAHLHLMINHFPVIGTIFSFILLATALLIKNEGIEKAGLGLFILSGFSSVPAFFSGIGAEKALESIDHNSGIFIEGHEGLAEIALWTCIGVGIMSSYGLLLSIRKNPYVRKLSFIILLLSAGNIVLLRGVAYTGGEIRHKEIRKQSPAGVSQDLDERGGHTFRNQ